MGLGFSFSPVSLFIWLDMKQFLLDQFATCYDTNGWFVAIRNSIDGMTVEQAAWKPADQVNCVWETLSHLTYYNNAYLQRFKGIDFEYDVDNNDQTFTTGEFTEADWQAEIAGFDSMMTEWRSALESADESKLAELVPNKGETTWAEIIGLINTHNSYHAGQILVLRKLHGNWDAAQGVS